MDYYEAKRHAQHYAAVTRQDYGVMRDAFGGTMAFILPPPDQRSGSELFCEVVRYADLSPADIQWHMAADNAYGDLWQKHV